MNSDNNNAVWDKNGECLKCGFIPFNVSEKCYACDDKSNSSDVSEEEVSWEINREKDAFIDVDNSTYEELFLLYKETNDLERLHFIERSVYRRFLNEVIQKKYTNLNDIAEISYKITQNIITPN